jgi:hypothetical protein
MERTWMINARKQELGNVDLLARFPPLLSTHATSGDTARDAWCPHPPRVLPGR